VRQDHADDGVLTAAEAARAGAEFGSAMVRVDALAF
jgi:hypothetical protein